MNHRSRIVIACGVSLLAGVTGASDAPAPSIPGRPGDSWSYEVITTVTNLENGATATLKNGVLTRTILESKVPGKLIAREEAKGFGHRYVKGPQDSQPVTVSYFSDGRVDEIVGGGSAPVYRLINLETIKLPDTALKLGLKWSWTIDEDVKKGTPKLSTDYHLSEDGEYQGFPAWKIEFSSRELERVIPGKMDGYVWLRKADLVQLEVTDAGSNLPVPGTTDLVRRQLTATFMPELEKHSKVVPPDLQSP